MNGAQEAYDALIKELRELALLGSINSLLSWDEQTHLPPKGAEHRANQMAYLAAMHHRRFTSPKMGELLHAVESSDLLSDPDSDIAVNVRETRRSFDKSRKL